MQNGQGREGLFEEVELLQNADAAGVLCADGGQAHDPGCPRGGEGRTQRVHDFAGFGKAFGGREVGRNHDEHVLRVGEGALQRVGVPKVRDGDLGARPCPGASFGFVAKFAFLQAVLDDAAHLPDQFGAVLGDDLARLGGELQVVGEQLGVAGRAGAFEGNQGAQTAPQPLARGSLGLHVAFDVGQHALQPAACAGLAQGGFAGKVALSQAPFWREPKAA